MPRPAAPVRRRSKLRPQFEPLEGRALLSRASLPSAHFSWSMPERFGIDRQTIHYNPTTGITTLTPGPDGVIDYNNSQSYVNPTSWELDLNGSTSSGGKIGRTSVPISDYTFIVDGKTYDSGSSPPSRSRCPPWGPTR